jgi:TRAP-type C4-dicarboxylate transport system substrate-binding protein
MQHCFRESVSACVLTCAMLLGAGSASAQQSINISAISGYAPTASWVKIFEEYFIPEVDRILAESGEFRVNWNRGFSGTVVRPRGELEGVATGIGDIGIIVPPFHVDRIPLHNVSFVTPFSSSDLHLLIRAMNEIAEKVPGFKQEWEDLNLVYLGSAGSVNDYQAVCKSNKPEPAAFEGAKIVGAGTNLLYFQGVGAVGISSNLGDFYNAMQTGIADCAAVWAEAAAGFKMHEVAPYFIKADLGAAASFAVAANADFWNALPEPVADALRQSAEGYGIALADYVVSAADDALKAYEANGGTIVQYTVEQRQEWANSLPNLAQEWAANTDRLGKPGTEVLTTYMDILRENDQAILREWDKE